MLTGVKQGRVVSPMFFGVTIDRVLSRYVGDYHQGIIWTENTPLEDRDFADDLVLLCSIHACLLA